MTIHGRNKDSLLSAVRWDDKMSLRTNSNMMQNLVDEQLSFVSGGLMLFTLSSVGPY